MASSRSTITTLISTNLADNSTKDISASDVRQVMNELNTSNLNTLTDTEYLGWHEFSVNKAYLTGELVIYNNSLYKFNQDHSEAAWNSSHADLFTANGATQFSASLTISSAEVLALNSTPKTLVVCPTGKSIVVTGASLKCGAGNTAYLVEADVNLLTDTATIPQVKFTNILTQFSLQAHVLGIMNAISYAADTQIISDKDLIVQCPSADPTTGNYNITVYVTFRLL